MNSAAERKFTSRLSPPGRGTPHRRLRRRVRFLARFQATPITCVRKCRNVRFFSVSICSLRYKWENSLVWPRNRVLRVWLAGFSGEQLSNRRNQLSHSVGFFKYGVDTDSRPQCVAKSFTVHRKYNYGHLGHCPL
jgi:hypothetical protein